MLTPFCGEWCENHDSKELTVNLFQDMESGSREIERNL